MTAPQPTQERNDRQITRWRILGSEMALFGVVAIIVGIVTALGAYALHWSIKNGMIGEGFHIVLRLATGSQWTVPVGGPSPAWWGYLLVLGLPVVGLLVAAGLVRLFSRGEHGHGVAGVMEAVALHGGRLPARPALARIVAAACTIISGGSVGSADPNVQIGATAGSWIGQRLRFAHERVQALVACGAASGIAAAFNAPIAGVFFAQEIILGEFSTTAFSMVVLSSVTSSVITHILRGENPAFRIPAYTLRSPLELFLYLGLGLLAAAISAAYVWGLLRIEDLSQRWRVPFWIKAPLGGLAVGAVGLAFPYLFGTGYEAIETLLQGEHLALWILLALILLKPLLTATSLASGGSGGVFAPSLFIGCVLGAAFGQVANQLFPNVTAPAPAYALVGMGGVLAGAVHCPVTAILLLFEMTRDYHIILPIMLCAVVSTLISRWLSPDSAYTERLTRRGLHLHLGRDVNVMEMVTVEEAMSRDFDVVRPEMTLDELRGLYERSSQYGFPVVDAQGRLAGIVTQGDYRQALEESPEKTVADICTRKVVTVFPGQSLHDAMRLLASRGIGQLPVVSSGNPQQIIGLLRRHDTIRAYNKGLTRQMEIRKRIQQMRLTSYWGGELIDLELPAESGAAGQWIRDLNLPPGTIIATVQRGERTIVPRGNTTLEAGDHLVLIADSAETGKKARALLLEGEGLPQRGETHYGEYVIPSTAPAVGKRIDDLEMPRDSLVVSVKRNGLTTIAQEEVVLEAGDQVVVLAEDDDLPLVEFALLGKAAPRPGYAFKDILVPVDGSDHGWLALEQALEVASRVNGTIHGLFVIEEDLLEDRDTASQVKRMPSATSEAEDLETLYRHWGKQVLAELQHHCQQRGVDGSGTIRRGRLEEVVAQQAATRDLVTMVYRGHYRKEGLPSTLEQVVHRADVPVLAAIHHPQAIGRLLVAYDGGPASQRALHVAAQMSLAFQAAVDVLTVQEDDEDVEALLRQATTVLERHGVTATHLQRRGRTSEQIIAAAEEQGSDLILVGIYQHGYLRQTLAGCALDELLHRTPLPLLICRWKD